MLDEFPALGRLDFFESTLAFMAGYGIKAFLIAQSLNQIEKAYGQNNAILDNCHVRVSFAANDERTAKRVSDALGTATEMRAMKNYAGHRLSPWLGHLMISRSETARALLTPGEILQLPPDDEIVMAAGLHPIKANKAKYYEDPRLTQRLLAAPQSENSEVQICIDDWTNLPLPPPVNIRAKKKEEPEENLTQSGESRAQEMPQHSAKNFDLRREPDLDRDMDIAPEPILKKTKINEFELDERSPAADGDRNSRDLRTARNIAQQLDMDIGF